MLQPGGFERHKTAGQTQRAGGSAGARDEGSADGQGGYAGVLSRRAEEEEGQVRKIAQESRGNPH